MTSAGKLPYSPRRHLIRGVLVGLGMGALLSLWTTFRYLAGWSSFAEDRIAYGTAVLICMAGGVAAGTVAGVLQPRVRSRWTAVGSCFLFACVVFYTMGMARGEPDLLNVAVMSALVGGVLGWRYWTQVSVGEARGG